MFFKKKRRGFPAFFVFWRLISKKCAGVISYGADVAASGTSNATALGNAPPGAPTNNVNLGNTSVTVVAGQVNYSTYASDRRVKRNYQWNVPGVEFIKLLKPVTYNVDVHKMNSMLGYPMKRDSAGNSTGVPDTSYWEGKYDVERMRFSGFIAQEVDSAAQQVGYDFSGVVKGEKLLSLRYAEFVVPLVKAVQEQQKMIDSLFAIINTPKNSQRTSGQNNSETTSEIELSNKDNVILYQNEPNPFDGSTVIRYFLPDNTTGNAFVVFYDMYGKEVGKLEIREKGFGKIEANTENLAAGIYSYSIVVNEQAIDTKKMVRNK